MEHMHELKELEFVCTLKHFSSDCVLDWQVKNKLNENTFEIFYD